MDDFGEVFECPSTWYECTGMGKMPWNNTSLEVLSSETSCRLSGPQQLPSCEEMMTAREAQGAESNHMMTQKSFQQYSSEEYDDVFLVSEWTQALGFQNARTKECGYKEQMGGDKKQIMIRDDMQVELHNNNPANKRVSSSSSYEGWISSQVHKINQEKPHHIKCSGQYAHTQVCTASATGPSKPRQRARRGQATDPHSIAERLRRERIATRIKELQELVPNSNKVDRISLLDDIIDYVRFLQLQAKVFNMSRLGGAGAIAPLVADISEGQSSNDTISMQRSSQKDDMEVTEQEVAKLMETNITLAMRYLQSKGLCLMPISLVTAISSMDNRHSTDDSEVYTSCV